MHSSIFETPILTSQLVEAEPTLHFDDLVATTRRKDTGKSQVSLLQISLIIFVAY